MPKMVMHREPVAVYVAEADAHRTFHRGMEVADDDVVLRDPSLQWLFEDVDAPTVVESVPVEGIDGSGTARRRTRSGRTGTPAAEQ